MKEIGLILQHRVLVIAEPWPGVGDEMHQDLQGLLARIDQRGRAFGDGGLQTTLTAS